MGREQQASHAMQKTGMVFKMAWLIAVVGAAGFTCIDLASPFSFRYFQEEEAMNEARDRIMTVRRGTVEIDFGLEHAGKEVMIIQRSHQFLFGANAFFLNQITNATLKEEGKRLFASLFNYATLPFYMKQYNGFNPNLGTWQDALRAMTAWLHSANITVKAHPVIWQIAGQIPDEIEYNTTGDERQAFTTDHIQTILGNHTDIKTWDLVNEMTHVKNVLLGSTASETWKNALSVARASRPDCTFIANEYETIQAGNAATAANDAGVFYDFVENIIEDGYAPDAIGFQAHEFMNAWLPVQDILDTFDSFGTFKIPCHVTEFDAGSSGYYSGGRTIRRGLMTEQSQADLATRAYTVMFSHPAVHAITWWAFYRDLYWMPERGNYIMDGDGRVLPVYEALYDLIHVQWNSSGKYILDNLGRMSVTGFYGNYSARVDVHTGREFAITDNRAADERPWQLAEI